MSRYHHLGPISRHSHNSVRGLFCRKAQYKICVFRMLIRALPSTWNRALVSEMGLSTEFIRL